MIIKPNNCLIKKSSNLSDKKQNQQSDSLLNISSVSKSFYGQGQNYPNNNLPIKRELCKEHNEPLSYFCFDCMVRCVCSECVVHGSHKNHDVLNKKRAYPIVVEKVTSLYFSS